MASVFADSKGIVLQFRGLAGRRQLRVKLPHAQAVAQAKECERLCRVLETQPTTGAVQRALEIRAITDEQANELLYLAAPTKATEVTIREAALAHPTSERERALDHHEILRHLNELTQFVEYTGVSRLGDLKLHHIQRYVEHLRVQGYAWDSRRHRIIMLRRACRMAPSYGLHDILSGMQIDRREKPAPVITIPPEDIHRIADLCRHDEICRPIFALGMCCLRPSEIIRADFADLEGNQLSIGTHEAKNLASVRTLPLPPCVLRWQPHTEGPLVRRNGRRMDKFGVGHEWKAGTEEHDKPFYPVKILRKTAATMLIENGADPGLVDSYMGHTHSGVLAVTARHYLGPRRTAALQPIADLLHHLLHPLLSD